MTIGEVIRKYRKALGLTQEEMANRLGVSAPYRQVFSHAQEMILQYPDCEKLIWKTVLLVFSKWVVSRRYLPVWTWLP